MRQLHSASGLFPLGAYLFFHAWEHWPVRESRDALFERLEHSHSAPLELLFVVLPLIVHASLGLRLAREPSGLSAYTSRSFRHLQIATGVVAGAFLAFHLLTVWLPRLFDQNPLGAAYGAMVERSGDLPGVVLHAVGIAAVCTHFGQGLGIALGRLWPGQAAQRLCHPLGIALGVLLWLTFLNELASYAAYAPLL
jgi:succinate dehydrogenase/fumarate reductase cytochrome b subunit